MVAFAPSLSPRAAVPSAGVVTVVAAALPSSSSLAALSLLRALSSQRTLSSCLVTFASSLSPLVAVPSVWGREGGNEEHGRDVPVTTCAKDGRGTARGGEERGEGLLKG